MSFFPNESYSFPDLQPGKNQSGDAESISPKQENFVESGPEVISETTPGVPSPQRAAPVMPVIPTVPDQLEQVAQSASSAAEPESVPVSTRISDEDENFTAHDYAPPRRRWGKLARFLIMEAIALGALLVFAKLEVEERFSKNSLTYLYGTVMFIAAIAAALIPVIFYALPPRLPPAPPRE